MRSFPVSVLCLSLLISACGAPVFVRKHNSPGPTNPQRRPTQNPEDCAAASVHRIDRPEVPGQAGAKTFTYSYDLIPATAPGAPTIVYVPGGPGQTAIGSKADWLDKLPDGYGLLLTDPRGVGCNANGLDEYGSGFYRSEYVAGDIIAAVGDAKIDNWVVFGISYGTLVSTMTASLAEKAGGTHPKAVVLEGTIGKAMTTGEDTATYKLLWSADLANHPGAQTAFADADHLPLGYSASDWEQSIQTSLMLGAIKRGGDAVDIMNLLINESLSTSASDQDNARALLDSFASSGVDESVKGFDAFYTYIACQEIWPGVSGLSLKNGQLVTATDGTNLCASANLSLTNAYDAKKWPIAAPVYYLQGQNDPATPVASAVYHLTSETTSKNRMMALVGAGGHNPFEWSLLDQTAKDTHAAAAVCYQGIWQAMAAGQSIKDALGKCSWKYGVSLLSFPNGTLTTDVAVAATSGVGPTTSPAPIGTATSTTPSTATGTATSTSTGTTVTTGSGNPPVAPPLSPPGSPVAVSTATGAGTGSPFPPVAPGGGTNSDTGTSSDTVVATITTPDA